VKVLYLHLSNDKKNKATWISKYLPKDEYDFQSIPIPSSSLLRRLFFVLLCPSRISNYDVVVTTEYYLAFFLNIRLLLTRCSVKHVVWGLNQSRRLLVFRSVILNNIVNHIFNRANTLITHSKREKKLFSDIHSIDIKKFKFVHWGYDLPTMSDAKYVDFDDEYVCMIGRNNRDWKTFANAVNLSGVKGVAVCSSISEIDRSILLAAGIHVFENLRMEDCLNVIKYAIANVVLVNDDNRGAGHITIVSAMLMSKPQIISNVDVLNEYFEDGVHGYTVPINSHKKSNEAIIKLIKEPELRRKFGKNAKEYAVKWFTNKHVADEFCYISKNFFCEEEFDS